MSSSGGRQWFSVERVSAGRASDVGRSMGGLLGRVRDKGRRDRMGSAREVLKPIQHDETSRESCRPGLEKDFCDFERFRRLTARLVISLQVPTRKGNQLDRLCRATR